MNEGLFPVCNWVNVMFEVGPEIWQDLFPQVCVYVCVNMYVPLCVGRGQGWYSLESPSWWNVLGEVEQAS